MKKSIKKQKGQALLIVILVMIVALTIGLSLATRTIINLKNTTEEVNSQKALSAAEAGIEASLNAGAPKTNLSFNGTRFETTAGIINAKEFVTNGGSIVARDDSVD